MKIIPSNTRHPVERIPDATEAFWFTPKRGRMDGHLGVLPRRKSPRSTGPRTPTPFPFLAMDATNAHEGEALFPGRAKITDERVLRLFLRPPDGPAPADSV